MRNKIIDKFISTTIFAGATRKMLAGDASFRKYERVFLGDKQAVLMDAPPDKEDVRPFINIAEYLAECDMSAPQIIAQDIKNGLLLLEDLGDDLFARVLEKTPEKEEELYLAATDVLIELYKTCHSSESWNLVPQFTPEKMLAQVALLPEWYPQLNNIKIDAQSYMQIWQEIIAKLPDIGKTLVLYDFHAENLLWLPNRQAHKKAGLLDFQDAMIGSPAYDMVSFLEDARRDVKPETVSKVIDYYLAKTGIAKDDFMLAYHILGAQRNCRIIGTFSRLALRDGKEKYLSFMPRVWQHIANDVSHPALAPLKQWLENSVAK